MSRNLLLSFLVSVAAGLAVYYITKNKANGVPLL